MQPTRQNLFVSEEQRRQLCGIHLLQLLTESSTDLEEPLQEDLEFLAPVVEWMTTQGYVESQRSHYQVTSKGRDVLTHFLRRYRSFLAEMDVYCAVDLTSGEFAFSQYENHPTKDSWERYLAQERWDDVRIALCEWQGKDPIEAVFMGFMEQGRFGYPRQGWEYDGFLGAVWEEIAHTAQSALRLQDLAFEDQGTFYPASQVAQDIYEQGQTLIRGI